MEFSTLGINSPKPSQDIYYGVAGELVRLIEPQSEADPLAIHMQFMVAFGNAAGRSPHFMAEADRHGTNLFTVSVGSSAKARKGMSWNHAREPVAKADPDWVKRIHSGLSSGEGLIWPVRDPMRQLINGRNVQDPGVSDKRLLVYESEFGSVLRVLGRDGNTLSAVIRNAWDGADLGILTKNNPARATGPHISLIGHITQDELLRYLSNVDAANGFGNRICWLWTQRSKLLPEGGHFDAVLLGPIIEKVKKALDFARNTGELRRDGAARILWHDVYPTLAESKPGLLGAITARAEPIVMRLALLYALLDCSSAIGEPHLRAALALWDYMEASAGYIFNEKLGHTDTNKLFNALRNTPDGLTRTEISGIFNNNRSKEQIGEALATLVAANQVRSETTDTGGRRVERWFAK